MLMHRGGHNVAKGTYWNIANGQRVDIADEGALPGNHGARYIKMSSALILMLGPVAGLLFAAFLPFIGIAMTLNLIAKKLVTGAAHVAVKSTSFGWRPIEAYLNGKQRGKKEVKGSGKNART